MVAIMRIGGGGGMQWKLNSWVVGGNSSDSKYPLPKNYFSSKSALGGDEFVE
jgi:hypothetical protein